MKIQDGTRVLTSFSTLPHCHPVCDTVGEAEACGVTLPHTVIPSWELTSMVTQGWPTLSDSENPFIRVESPWCQSFASIPPLEICTTSAPPPLQQTSWGQQPHPASGKQTALTPHCLKRRGRWGLHLEACATPQTKTFGCVFKITRRTSLVDICAPWFIHNSFTLKSQHVEAVHVFTDGWMDEWAKRMCISIQQNITQS